MPFVHGKRCRWKNQHRKRFARTKQVYYLWRSSSTTSIAYGCNIFRLRRAKRQQTTAALKENQLWGDETYKLLHLYIFTVRKRKKEKIWNLYFAFKINNRKTSYRLWMEVKANQVIVFHNRLVSIESRNIWDTLCRSKGFGCCKSKPKGLIMTLST